MTQEQKDIIKNAERVIAEMKKKFPDQCNDDLENIDFGLMNAFEKYKKDFYEKNFPGDIIIK